MTRQRTTIQAALARLGGKPIEIDVELSPDETLTFRFVPGIGIHVADMIDAIVEAQREKLGIRQQFETIKTLLVSTAAPDNGATIENIERLAAVDLVAAIRLGVEVMREVSGGMNPTQSSSSPAESSATGETSTASASPQDSTHLHSPSINS